MGREEGTFPMLGGGSMARRMTNVVGANSVQGSVRSSKVRATTWVGPESYGLGTDMWARRCEFLGAQSLIGVL